MVAVHDLTRGAVSGGEGQGGRLRHPLLLRMEAESEPAGRWWQSMT